ncbi:MAG: endonuclease [Tannerellaceae bacterium]|jgi:endonuclease/exonuclease/phosphatase family metal-dependent hydrolase|nr:endonuclease [Tannerellaceae bacterium]
MYPTRILLLAVFLLSPAFPSGQVSFRVMSYNVENLFDIYDDPETEDEEFLPSGGRRWTPSRYMHKLRQIARVISAAGEWDTPALVGLCEVENDTVLTHLLTRTPLRRQQYRYLVTRGSDRRGINVALLYQRDKFRYLGHRSVPLRFRAAGRSTRDILHVWGELSSRDTLDVIVCHFPSKYGGEKESEALRLEAAHTLGRLSDSLSHLRLNPLQIIMGDFNEEPGSRCMQLITGANLLNLFAAATPAATHGSQKYQSNWNQLDQIIIHRRMNHPKATMRLVSGSARTFSPSFLLTADKTWRGQRPWRTYHGFRYEAGYSDHLPVIADFIIVAK